MIALRQSGDTMRVDHYSHPPPSGGNPGLNIMAFGTSPATQRRSGECQSVAVIRQDTASHAARCVTDSALQGGVVPSIARLEAAIREL